MKIRTGFVSNSSSSSFVVLLPKDWEPTDKELLKNMADFIDEKLALEEVKKAIKSLKNGGSISEQEDHVEFRVLEALIPDDYIVTSFDVSSGDGEIQGLDVAKVKKILKNI
jgi:uncharacterized protein YeeX (DUF496 family)